MTKIPPYFSGFDVKEILTDHPIDKEFTDKFIAMSKDELRSIQEKKFLKCVNRAWNIPFYEKHWKRDGLVPGDINKLEDIVKIPTFEKKDLMNSIANNPPL